MTKRFYLSAVTLILTVFVGALAAQDWIQQNGAMTLRAGTGAAQPLMVVDQRGTGKIASFRYQGTEKAYIDSTGFVGVGLFTASSTPTDCSTAQYSFTIDTNTGYAYGGGDTFKICAGGNNVIIGTPSQISFVTSATTKWVIDTNGHFLSNNDNAIDIGANGANRPRNIFVAGTIKQFTSIQGANGSQLIDTSDGIWRFATAAGTSFTRLILGTNDATVNGLGLNKDGSGHLLVTTGDNSAYRAVYALSGNFAQSALGGDVANLSSIATNDDPTEKTYQNRLATTDATVTTVQSVAIPATTTVLVSCMVVNRRTGGVSGTAEDGAGYRIEVVMKNVAGTATEIAAETTTTIGESIAGYNVTSAPSGANELIQVTGAATTNITWHSTCRSYPVGS